MGTVGSVCYTEQKSSVHRAVMLLEYGSSQRGHPNHPPAPGSADPPPPTLIKTLEIE